MNEVAVPSVPGIREGLRGVSVSIMDPPQRVTRDAVSSLLGEHAITYEELCSLDPKVSRALFQSLGIDNFILLIKTITWNTKDPIKWEHFLLGGSEIYNSFIAFFSDDMVAEHIYASYTSKPAIIKFKAEHPNLFQKIATARAQGKATGRTFVVQLYKAYCIMIGYDEVGRNYDLFG